MKFRFKAGLTVEIKKTHNEDDELVVVLRGRGRPEFTFYTPGTTELLVKELTKVRKAKAVTR